MMRRLSAVIAVIFIALASGCAAQPPKVPVTIKASDGIIVTRIASNSHMFNQMIHQVEHGSGTGNLLGSPVVEMAVPGTTIFKTNAVDLYFSNLLTPLGNILWPRKEDCVQVKPVVQKIVYIGDVFIKVTNTYGNYLVSYQISDNESETVAEARKQRPDLFAKYEYVKALAVDPTAH
jgi:hypothetical protein